MYELVIKTAHEKLMKNKRSPNKNPLATLALLINNKFILALFFIGIQRLNSQNSQTFHVPDSLKNKTYKELFERYNANYTDPIKAEVFAKAYLHKARNEKDTIRIANAYSQFASINNFQISVKYCDSIIDLTKKLDHFEYPGYGYMAKGISYFNLGDYEKALDNYLIAQQYAIKNNNIEQHFYINNEIGQLKNFWGSYDEALKIFKSQLQLLRQNKSDFKNPQQLYLNVLFHLTNSYILTEKLDSAFIYSKKGIQESLLLNDSIQYYDFVSQAGIVAYYQNHFKIALDSLNKALPYETFNNGLLNNHYYSGNIYWKQNKDAKAFYHFKQADSIYNLTNDAVPEVRDIQEFFVNYYKKNNDIENQLKYIDRLLYVDSIISKNRKNLNETLVKKYDTPLLLSEKEKIINNLKKAKKKASFTIFGLITLVLIILAFFIRFYKIQRVFKERFNNLLLKETETKKLPEKPTKELNGISKKIIESTLLRLEEFEISNAFLDNNLTLNSLSKFLNTNSNYLSKIINTYKEKNFSSYISDLRIDYCLEKLKTDTTFRKYTINAIAFEIGFNNVESFSKTFYKKTGVYPSYFIKEIEKDHPF